MPQTILKSYSERSFVKVVPILWHSLPFTIRIPDSLDSFKANLKGHLFPGADDTSSYECLWVTHHKYTRFIKQYHYKSTKWESDGKLTNVLEDFGFTSDKVSFFMLTSIIGDLFTFMMYW